MTKKTNQQNTANECSHKTYQGLRAPQVDCIPCWKKYFSTDTENKKKKYSKEYDKYMTVVVKPARVAKEKKEKETIEEVVEDNVEVKATPTTLDNVALRKNSQGQEVADVPIKVNRYFWSETLKATVKTNGYSNGMVSFIVDQRLVIPVKEIENLKLVPYSSDYFIYTTKRVPAGAEGLKMTVFTPQIIGTIDAQVVVGAQQKHWPTDDIIWPPDAKLAAEECPQPIDPDAKVKKKRKKVEK